MNTIKAVKPNNHIPSNSKKNTMNIVKALEGLFKGFTQEDKKDLVVAFELEGVKVIIDGSGEDKYKEMLKERE